MVKNEARPGYHLVIDAINSKRTPAGRASSRPGAQSSSPDISGSMSSSTSRTCPRWSGPGSGPTEHSSGSRQVSDPMVGQGRFRPCRATSALLSVERGIIGRVGWNTVDGPQILPVTYAFRDGSIVFRTAPYGALSELRTVRQVAFDQFDTQTRTGWRCWWSASPAPRPIPKSWSACGSTTSPCRGRRAAGNLFIVIKLDQVSAGPASA